MERKDSFVMQGRRNLLVETLKEKGIKNEEVIRAIATIPRHFFVLAGLEFQAYEDKALSITDAQTISQPYTVAFQTELLEIKKGDKIMEIGTGSGYQAAVLAEVGAEVYSIERILNLHEKAVELFNELGYKINTFYGDGYIGLPDKAPFDGIILTAAIPQIPDNLLKQLKIGGKFVAPVGEQGETQQMMRLIRKSETEFDKQFFGGFVFVPMLKGKV